MKKTAAISLGLFGLFASATVLAAGGWSNFVAMGVIESDLMSSAPGGVGTYIQMLPVPNGSPSSCPLAGTQTQALLDTSSLEHAKQMASIATAALLSGKPVKVHFSGACGGQSNIYPIVDGLLINN